MASTKGDGPEKNQSLNNGPGWHCPAVPALGFMRLGSLMSVSAVDQNQLSKEHAPRAIFSTDVTF